MTKGAALQAFFAQFMDAYPASAVPDDVVLPYLTYELKTGAFDTAPVAITVNLWFHTESEATPNAEAEKLAKAIGRGGVTLVCDDGLIWLKRGEPWCQAISTGDNSVKRRYINVTAEYLTFD